MVKLSINGANLLPTLFASLLTELGEYQAKQITIRPVEDMPGAALTEILECCHGKGGKDLAIITRSKSGEQLALEQDLPEQHRYRVLLDALQQERTRCQIEAMQREREQMLGLSSLQTVLVAPVRPWPAELQNILVFFLPYQAQIRGDLPLAQKCLQAALSLPICLEQVEPPTHNRSGAVLDASTLEYDSRCGGDCPSEAPHVLLTIGPVPLQALEEVAPGGRKWRFLNTGLLPLILPEGWEWTIRVRVEPQYETFRIATPGQPLFTDINTILS